MEGSMETALPVLSMDVLSEILKRVPAESVIHWKRVCKIWHRLINSQCFVESHLKHWRSTSIIVPGRHSSRGMKPLMFLYPFNFKNQEVRAECTALCLDEFLVYAFPELRTRVHSHICASFSVLDSCDGLILFRVYDNCSADKERRLVICNPITKSATFLPRCNLFRLREFQWRIAGDGSLEWYKIVGIPKLQGFTPDRTMTCLLFNLQKGKARESTDWKELRIDIPWEGSSHLAPPAIPIGTNAHWVIQLNHCKSGEEEGALLSLDLLTERLTLAKILPQMPYSIHGSRHWFLSDRVICCGSVTTEYSGLELWVVEDFEHPVWHKRHVIRPPPNGFDVPFQYWNGVYVEEGGKLVVMFLYNEHVFVYDPSTGEWRITVPDYGDVPDRNLLHVFCRHVNSLVRCD